MLQQTIFGTFVALLSTACAATELPLCEVKPQLLPFPKVEPIHHCHPEGILRLAFTIQTTGEIANLVVLEDTRKSDGIGTCNEQSAELAISLLRYVPRETPCKHETTITFKADE